MPSIQQRNWQEVDEPEIYGEQGHQLHERQCAERRSLSGKLSDLDRPTNVLAPAAAGDDLAKPIDHSARDLERVDRSCGHDLRGGKLRVGSLAAKNPDAAD